MTIATFNGRSIFGTVENRVIGPTGSSRVQRSILPGVRGFRNYSLTGGVGPDTLRFIATGRILAFSVGQAERMILDAQKMMDGKLYAFRSTGGNVYRNCQLVAFAQTENYRKAFVQNLWLVTTRVSATIEQASP
jgi:hypothetical protein